MGGIKMKTNLSIIKEFSRRTGITDPAIDSYIKLQETDLGSIEEFSKRTSITDPKVDYFTEKQNRLYKHLPSSIDWRTSTVAPEPEEYEQINADYFWSHYRPHKWQERFFRSDVKLGRNTSGKDIPQGKLVISGIRAWDDKPLSEAEKQARENRLDKIDEKVSAMIDNQLNCFRRTVLGSFGGFSMCEPRRNTNYVDGEWRETPKKLPEPQKKLTGGKDES